MLENFVVEGATPLTRSDVEKMLAEVNTNLKALHEKITNVQQEIAMSRIMRNNKEQL